MIQLCNHFATWLIISKYILVNFFLFQIPWYLVPGEAENKSDGRRKVEQDLVHVSLEELNLLWLLLFFNYSSLLKDYHSQVIWCHQISIVKGMNYVLKNYVKMISIVCTILDDTDHFENFSYRNKENLWLLNFSNKA